MKTPLLRTLSKLPRIMSATEQDLESRTIGVHFVGEEFHFYCIEYDPADHLLFGLVESGYPRVITAAYFSLSALAYMEEVTMQPIHYDPSWREISVASLFEKSALISTDGPSSSVGSPHKGHNPCLRNTG